MAKYFFLVSIILAIFLAIFLRVVGLNPIGYFVSSHSYMTTKLALKLGFNPNSCERDCPLFIAAVFQDFKMIKILENHGADIHILDKQGNNILNVSCTQIDVLDYFTTKGVNVNNQALDNKGMPGMTPLFCATLSKDVDAVKFLISKGADKTKAVGQWAGQKNVTPLQLATSKNLPELIKALQ